MFCFNCGAENPDTARYCFSCGINLRPVLASGRRLGDAPMASPDDPARAIGDERTRVPIVAPVPGSAAPQVQPWDLSPGTTIDNGRYTVVDRLGKGGMGVVYRVVDHTMRDKHFALKGLSQAFAADPAAVEDVRAEVLTAQALNHPNIIAVHDLIEDIGTLFIKMELVEGQSLRQIQRASGRVPWQQVVEWMVQSCDGFEYAHNEHVLHTDIKPGNLMLDETGRIRIADFGLAVLLEEQASHLSLKGVQAGTLNYMSPEQYLGLRVSRRSDVYSLGATAYALINGKPPFKGAGFEYRLLHHNADPLDDVPDWLNAVIQQTLAKDENRRPGSMRHLQRMIKHARDAGELQTDATGSGEHALAALPDLARLREELNRPPVRRDAEPVSPAPVPPAPAPVPATPRPAPAMHGKTLPATLVNGEYTLIDEIEFRCPNDVEGEKVFRVPAYRCELFASAIGLPRSERSPDTEFVLLPPAGHTGQFVMGSPEEEQSRGEDELAHTIRLRRPFLLARTVLSHRVLQAVGDPVQTVGNAAPEMPATGMTWTDAVIWCRKHQMRLPSESEWEYAARAGTQTPFCCGSQLPTEIANYDGNYPYAGGSRGVYRGAPVAIGSLPANAFGLHEVHGNVCEWVRDCYVGDYHVTPTDGTPFDVAGQGERVIRGGSWDHLAQGCRSAVRYPYSPGRRSELIGLRPAASV